MTSAPKSTSALSFLSWKPTHTPSVAAAANEALAGTPSRSTAAVREFLKNVDPLLASASVTKLFDNADVSKAIMHLDEVPANTVATSTLLQSLLKNIQTPPPFADVYAQAGKRTIDTAFATDLLRSAALSPSPKEAYDKVANLANSKATMSECGRAFCEALGNAISDGTNDVGALYHAAMFGHGGGGVRGARDALAAFDKALKDFDPALAEKGHSELLWSGNHPKLNTVMEAISNASHGPEGENLSAHAAWCIAFAAG